MLDRRASKLACFVVPNLFTGIHGKTPFPRALLNPRKENKFGVPKEKKKKDYQHRAALQPQKYDRNKRSLRHQVVPRPRRNSAAHHGKDVYHRRA